MTACRVLHVEDEPDIREVVRLSLALDPQLTVRSVGGGHDVLAAAAEWQPDVILMDVVMPVMDGPQLLKMLQGAPPTSGIPVVFMTARAQPTDVAQFISLGAAGVIPKPFDPLKLAAELRACLGQQPRAA